MKKTTIAIATMSLILMLAISVMGQDRRRAPRQIGNPIGLGGTVSAGINQPSNQGQRAKRKSPTSTGDQPEMQITNRPQQNLGDTGTHEVGHKGKRRIVKPADDGTTEQFRTNAPKGPLGLTNTVSYDFRNQKTQRKAVPAPTPSPATIRKGGPKTTNFSWGVTQTGQFRTKQPRRP